MASLVLSAAGTALGGPVGGAIGSLVGRQIDRSFGRPTSDRLRDLRFPSSQYGDAIPTVVGRMRVGGVVLWSAKPVETTTVSKSGSSPGISVSFALGLSSGRLEKVSRIWADGRLIRDGQGRQDVSFELRLHSGDEDQPSDPLIASVLGDDAAPAFRGIAYLLFENLDLSSFGNRLPLITVEVTAGNAGVDAEQIIMDSLDLGGQSPGLLHTLTGYALSGDEMSEALFPIVDAVEPIFACGPGGWLLSNSPSLHLIEQRLWVLEADRYTTSDLKAAGRSPSKVSVRYFDPAIDFAASEKSARLPGPERLRRIELPAALSGEQAKAIAFEQLGRSSRGGTRRLRLPLSYSCINLGDEIACENEPESVFRVCTKELKAGELRFELRREQARVGLMVCDVGGVAGRAALERLPLEVALLELPVAASASDTEVAVLVSGGYEPFRPLTVAVSCDGCEQELLSSNKASPRGILQSPLHAGVTDLIDKRQTLEVVFTQDPLLVSVDDDTLLAGANLLYVGGEFLRFATAEPLGPSKYKLAGLLRGCFDSRAGPHAVGSAVYLVEPASYCTFTVPRDRLGATYTARAFGPDSATADASVIVLGLAERPWAPEHLQVDETEDGLVVAWVRRNADGVPWLDGVDTPLGASKETYIVSLSDMDEHRLELETVIPTVLIDLQSLTQLGARPWRLEVRQNGDAAPGNARTQVIL